jgi:cyclophilin family peptidyl-prolyl cis-trans isomerase
MIFCTFFVGALQLPRSAVLRGAGLTLVPLAAARADADSAASAATVATITDRVRLEFVQQVGPETQLLFPVTLGLFGKDAPQSVAAFKALCGGDYLAPCEQPADQEDALTQKGKALRRSIFKACLGSEAEPVSYAFSQVWRVLRDRRVDCGQVQGKFSMRRAPSTPLDESACLLHDAPGLLSVRRGGGDFDFGLTPSAAPEFDKDYVVIGRVIDGTDAVQRLSEVAVVKAAEQLGQGDGATASRAKVCSYGSAAAYCSQNKPLQKVMLRNVAVLV